MKAKVSEFDLGTVGGNLSVTGVGFQPQVVIFLINGLTVSGAGGADGQAIRGIGVGISSTDRRAVAANAYLMPSFQDATKCFIIPRLSSSLLQWTADLVSMDADGFTISRTKLTGATNNLKVTYVALAELTSVKTGSFTEPGSIGAQAITGLGFAPDAVLVFSTTPGDASNFMVGAGTSGGQAVLSTRSNALINGPGNKSKSYSRQGEMIAKMGSGISLDARATLQSLDSDGFTVNWTQVSASGRTIHYLAIKGGTWKIGSLSTRTDTANIQVTGIGGGPKVILFASHGKAQSAAGALDADDRGSMGAASGALARGAKSWSWADNQDVTTGVYGGESSESARVYDRLNPGVVNDGTPDNNLDGQMDMVSIDVDGFTAVMTLAEGSAAESPDASAKYVWFLVAYVPALNVNPTGIASAQALGTPSTGYVSLAGGIGSGEAFGSQTAIGNGKLIAVGYNSIPSGEAFGAAKLNLIAYTVGIASSGAFGMPGQAEYPNVPGVFHEPHRFLFSAAGPSSLQAFGASRVRRADQQDVLPVGVGSLGAFGVPYLGMRLIGIPSAEVVGAPIVRLEQVLHSGRVIRVSSSVKAEVS